MLDYFSYDLVISLLALTFLEIILGIDNLIFISLCVQDLKKKHRNFARIFGLSLALIIRVIMLLTLSWVMSLTKPLFTIGIIDFSFKDLLLIFGGIFLIVKSGKEIYKDLFHNGETDEIKLAPKQKLFAVIMQIVLVDFIFSFDSVITAIGMTTNIPIIVTAVVISMIVMLLSSEKITIFLQKYPSLKIVALAFIFMVGLILFADGFEIHISKGYLYFALVFTTIVESLNIVAKKR